MLLNLREKLLEMLPIKQQVKDKTLFERFSLIIFGIYLEQGEKLKRQASDAGERVKSAAQNAKQQVEEGGEGVLGKFFAILHDVKNSLLGKNFLQGKSKSFFLV
jgi:hypothetical protein